MPTQSFACQRMEHFLEDTAVSDNNNSNSVGKLAGLVTINLAPACDTSTIRHRSKTPGARIQARMLTVFLANLLGRSSGIRHMLDQNYCSKVKPISNISSRVREKSL
jgi:hypothetical protein